MSGLYFDQLHVGQRFATASFTMNAEEIRAFAAQYDPQPFHLDDAAARDTLFGGLVASGWQTAAVTMRLLQTGAVTVAGTVGIGAEICWLKPVRPGDCLHVESEVIAMAPSRSRPTYGRVTLRSETIDQHGTVVQWVLARMLVPRRVAAA